MPALKTYNKRALELLADAKHSGKAKNDKDWSKKIGINNANLSAVKRGDRDFTLDQIIAACKLVGVSMDWVAGRSSIKYIIKNRSLVDLLREATAMAEKL